MNAYDLHAHECTSQPQLLNLFLMCSIGGFTPWWYKYTSDGQGCPHCKHKGVETEWETMGIAGAYNAFDDGDACCVGTMANSAMYMHYPLPDSFKQNDKPTVCKRYS